MNWELIAQQLGISALFTGVGIVLLFLTFLVVQKVLPFSLRKEIEEDQNVALGIVIAAVIIGISLIVSASLHG